LGHHTQDGDVEDGCAVSVCRRADQDWRLHEQGRQDLQGSLHTARKLRGEVQDGGRAPQELHWQLLHHEGALRVQADGEPTATGRPVRGRFAERAEDDEPLAEVAKRARIGKALQKIQQKIDEWED